MTDERVSAQLVALAIALERGKIARREIEALSDQVGFLRVENERLRRQIEQMEKGKCNANRNKMDR